MTPREANTESKMCNLKRDNISFEEWWMALTSDSEVSICQQRAGEVPKASVSIPKKVFNQMVNWYNTGSKRGK